MGNLHFLDVMLKEENSNKGSFNSTPKLHMTQSAADLISVKKQIKNFIAKKIKRNELLSLEK